MKEMEGKCFLCLAALLLMTFWVKGQGKALNTGMLSTDSGRICTKPGLLKTKLRSFSFNYYDRLGAACKIEYKLEKASGIPFRFRLGSLEQTDYMERKPNAIKPSRMGH